MEQIEVRADQVWADNDQRMAGRTVRVERVADGFAFCTVLTDAETHQGKTRVGQETKLSIRRMRPTSTGWRLVEGKN